MKVQQVFTPNDTPTVTYVDRSEHKLEQTLRDHFDTPKIVVSISGPSKSGKTVLIRKVVPEDTLITVAGAGIESSDHLWDRVLGWMGAPSERTVTQQSNTQANIAGEAAGNAGIPFVAQGEAKASGGLSHSRGSEESKTYLRRGADQVIKEISNSSFVVFIDDFHYIKEELREEIGKEIKVAAENGVKIFTASVPHRADDVVRSNTELRGRVAAVDLAFWSENELKQIANKGFAALNVDLAPAISKRLAEEAFGSPQLMQAICLNLCYVLGIRETLPEHVRIDVSPDQLEETLLRTSTFTDFSKMVLALHTGPRTRGTERKEHTFRDGTKGDVYRSILLSVKSDPAKLSLSYEDILNRVRDVSIGEAPVGSSITSALEQMAFIATDLQPTNSPLAWDGDNLDITDPYFLFFVRCSAKLSDIADT